MIMTYLKNIESTILLKSHHNLCLVTALLTNLIFLNQVLTKQLLLQNFLLHKISQISFDLIR